MGTDHRLRPDPARPRSDAERVVRSLYEITTAYELGFPEQLRRILRLGVERTGLEVGIVSRVQGDAYTVVQAVSPNGTVGPGDKFDLPQTYCALTMKAGGPVGFTAAGDDPVLSRHPVYEGMRLEAYLGSPIPCAGEVFGTLNFSSTTKRTSAYPDADVEALQLMAGWIGGELARRRLADHVERLEGLIPICASCKHIRDELGGWNRLEAYLSSRADVHFSHGLCPTCAEQFLHEVENG